MARACYDPRGAIELWKNFEKQESKHTKQGAKLGRFFSTHPPREDRIAFLESKLEDAKVEFEKKDCVYKKRGNQTLK